MLCTIRTVLSINATAVAAADTVLSINAIAIAADATSLCLYISSCSIVRVVNSRGSSSIATSNRWW
jgi:hypothetical protein